VSWVYRNANTGAPMDGPPAYVTEIQLQIEDLSGARIYNSPNLSPDTTTHTLAATVNWSNVRMLHLAYGDSLNNQYVVTFSKP